MSIMKTGLAASLLALTLVELVPPVLAAEPVQACKQRYNIETKFLANPDESVLIAGVIGWCRKNKVRLLWDESYASVARLWSGYLVNDEISADRTIPVDRLGFELQQVGVTDANVIPFSVESPSERLPKELLTFLDEQAKKGRYSHFAVGVTRFPNQKRMITTLILGRRPAIINPLPVCPTAGSRLELHLKLLRSYRHPYWLMTTPKGLVIKDSMLYEEGAWHGTVPLDAGAGSYQLEIIVLGPEGPEVAALFPLYAGVERPSIPKTKLHPAPGRYRTPDDAEAALLKLTNKSRAKFGLPPLKSDDKISQIAREHAMQLLIDRHAAHRTKKTGALVDRLRKSGTVFARAAENVSLSPAPESAHERFMDSPGHRLNILDPNLTKIGIGIAMERGHQSDVMAVCEVFVESTEPGETSKLVERIEKIINMKRRDKGRFILGLDIELSQTALRSARRLAGLGENADPQKEGDQLAADLNDPDSGFCDVSIRYFRTTNPIHVLRSPELLDENINRLGIGVAKTSTSFPGEMWIAVIFAGR
ncbi:MAG: hypothetical protein JRJ87_19790 [Deltaproteobacteria bacterium]|nr:hypothetical protein [Deltaproteobacteria bacterium]